MVWWKGGDGRELLLIFHLFRAGLGASSPSRHLAESRSHVRLRFVCVGKKSALQDPKMTLISPIICSLRINST